MKWQRELRFWASLGAMLFGETSAGGVTSLIIFYFSLLSDHSSLPELVPPRHLGFCKCRHAQGSALHRLHSLPDGVLVSSFTPRAFKYHFVAVIHKSFQSWPRPRMSGLAFSVAERKYFLGGSVCPINSPDQSLFSLLSSPLVSNLAIFWSLRLHYLKLPSIFSTLPYPTSSQ